MTPLSEVLSFHLHLAWPLSSALPLSSFCSRVCVCFPCDMSSGSNFPPREKVMVHDAPRMNFEVSASGGAEAVARAMRCCTFRAIVYCGNKWK